MALSALPITDVRQLSEHFQKGCKPPASWRVGAEHEKIGVYSDGRAIAYAGGIRVILDRLAKALSAEPVMWEGHVIALKLNHGASITLEPGGQLELSGATAKDAHQAGHELSEHVALVKDLTADLGVSWLATGLRPFGTLEDVPWMPKGRYRVMREYLPTRGRLAHEMMKRTATVQANLDYSDEADCASKLRTAMGVTSIVTALFANSPITDGKPNGYQSFRAAVWLETDPDRCGLLPFAFREAPIFEAYRDWALDVPMFFVYRNDQYTPAGGMTFRRFLAEGFQGERATLADWELHLSTLFPEVRLKHYLEVRGADSGPLNLVYALPALWRGLLYDGDACQAAWRLVADLSMDERERVRREVPRGGLETRMGRRKVRDLAGELVHIATAGVRRLGGGEAALLDPLVHIVESGRAPAQRMLDVWKRTGGDVGKMIAALRY
jgi:glutamate--cysteine ligase